MQSDNTYRYYYGDYSTDFSGYYIKVIVLILMVTLGIMLMSHLPPLFVRPRRTARTLRIIAKLIKIRTRPAWPPCSTWRWAPTSTNNPSYRSYNSVSPMDTLDTYLMIRRTLTVTLINALSKMSPSVNAKQRTSHLRAHREVVTFLRTTLHVDLGITMPSMRRPNISPQTPSTFNTLAVQVAESMWLLQWITSYRTEPAPNCWASLFRIISWLHFRIRSTLSAS